MQALLELLPQLVFSAAVSIGSPEGLVENPAETRATDDELLVHAGGLEFERRNYAGALLNFEKALALAESPGALYGKAQALNRLERCSEAIAYYERAAELTPLGHPAQVHIQGGLVDCAYDLSERNPDVPPPPIPVTATLPTIENGGDDAGDRLSTDERTSSSARTRKYTWGRYQPVPLWKKLGLGISGGLFVSGVVSTVVATRYMRRYEAQVMEAYEATLPEEGGQDTWEICVDATRGMSRGGFVEVEDVALASRCSPFRSAVVARRASIGVAAVAGVGAITFVVLHVVHRASETPGLSVTPSGLALRF